MDSLVRELQVRKQSLERAIERAQAAIDAAPEGKLYVDNNKSSAQYFHVPENSLKRIYLSRQESSLIGKLADKEYAEKLLSKAQKEMKVLDRYLKILSKDSADLLYSEMANAKQCVVTPILLDEKTSRRRWSSQPYERSDSHPEHLKFQTRKGDMVRSKSEAFIANTYFELGIPYRYEASLLLKNQIRCYPDFTILDTSHRRIVYHEHFGLLDKSEYLADQLWKLNEYSKNGIYLGKNLIITFETEDYPFDPEQFRRSAREIFLQ